MPVRRLLSLLCLTAAFVLAVGSPAAAAAKGKKRKTPAPTPAPTPLVAPGELYGPPVPPLLRAAGSCLRLEPGYVVLAEVGEVGRAFKIDEDTETTASLQRGARLRILYVEGVDGPVA